MSKKDKTPRIGLPPEGWVRVVMDYYQDDGLRLKFDIGRGHRIVQLVPSLSPSGIRIETPASGKLRKIVQRKPTEEPPPCGRPEGCSLHGGHAHCGGCRD